jgi:ribosome modulation factor
MCLRKSLPFLLVLAATGCASMSKEECLTADWRTVGFHDGAAGRGADNIGDHRQACAEFGVVPNLDRYLEGRKSGLKEYCRSSRGYQEGLSGRSYGGVCPPDLEKGFKTATSGFSHPQLEADIRARTGGARQGAALKDIRKANDVAPSTILTSNDSNSRARALRDMQSRNNEKSVLERDIDNLKRRIEQLRQNADRERSGTDARYR